MGPVEKADVEVFSRRAAVASMLLDQGVEDASDEEILARCGFRMPVA